MIPLIILKLPRTTISQIKTDNYSVSGSLKATLLLGMDTETKEENTDKFLAQNTENEEINNEDNIPDSDIINSIDDQNKIDTLEINSRDDKTFYQCSSIGNIYSEDELNE